MLSNVLSTRSVFGPQYSSAPCSGSSCESEGTRELDQLFERFFGDGHRVRRQSGHWFAPAALWEDAQGWQLELELPGVSNDDLEVVAEQGTLKVSGERKRPEEERKYWHNERRYGRFERTWRLPESVDADSIQAELRDGVLRVKLAKKPEVQPKKITVATN